MTVYFQKSAADNLVHVLIHRQSCELKKLKTFINDLLLRTWWLVYQLLLLYYYLLNRKDKHLLNEFNLQPEIIVNQ